jgi:hypothetical protein
MTSAQHVIPIFTSSGTLGAYLVYPYIYNPDGEWIGWMARNRQVYSILGNYVGWLNDDPRILRKKSTSHMKPRLTPPPAPSKFTLPDIDINPPHMADLKSGTFDVLENAMDLLPFSGSAHPNNE